MTKIGSAAWMFTYLLLSAAVCFGQDATVTAGVDKSSVRMGETLTFTVSVAGDINNVAEPQLPSLAGFSLVNSSKSSDTVSKLVHTMNGPRFLTMQTVEFRYVLRPQKNGPIEIGSVEVVLDGKSYRTNPVKVTVGNAGHVLAQPNPSDPQDSDQGDELLQQMLQSKKAPSGGFRSLPTNPNEAFFIQVETDKVQAFEREQILVSWYIYTRGIIESLDRLKFPSLKGFWKEDIEPAPTLSFTDEVVNGVPYKKALLAVHALFAMSPGKAVIDEFKIRAAVRPFNSQLGIYTLGQASVYTRASHRVPIDVKPLPTEGRPHDFSGAVGDFKMGAVVEGESFKTNQPFSFKVKFEGTGNAKLIDLPPMQLPPTLEIYDQKQETKYYNNGRSFKQFEILLIPREAGALELPRLTVSIFNPVTQTYVQRTADKISLNVVPDSGQSTIPSEKLAVQQKTEKTDPGVQIEFSWSKGKWLTKQQKLIGWLALYGVIIMLLLIKAWRDLGWGLRQPSLNDQMAARFRTIYSKVNRGDWQGVGIDVTNAVYLTLGEASGLGGAHVELDKLLAHLPPSQRREIEEPISRMMETFAALGFAPADAVTELQDKKKIKSLVREIEKTLYKVIS